MTLQVDQKIWVTATEVGPDKHTHFNKRTPVSAVLIVIIVKDIFKLFFFFHIKGILQHFGTDTYLLCW